MIRSRLRRLCLFALLVGAGTAMRAQVTASLVSGAASIVPGEPFTVALRLDQSPGWHTYWANAGTGFPTTITWHLPGGFTAGEIQWPVPHALKDDKGVITGNGYEGDTYLLVTITPPSNLTLGTRITLKADADWLMCRDMCQPGSAHVSLELPVSNFPQPNPDWAAKLIDAAGKLPITLPPGWAAEATQKDKGISLKVTAPVALRAPRFFSDNGLIDSTADQAPAENGSTALVLSLPLSSEAPAVFRLTGVLAYTDNAGTYSGVNLDLPLTEKPLPVAAQAPPASAAETHDYPLPGKEAHDSTLPGTLAFAFVGGLILNLMPCVFPVIGIKILGFTYQSGHDRRKVVAHGLTFSAGVLLSFWSVAAGFIGVRSGGAHLGWGFQLQSPGFVFTLAVIMLVFALCLSGVFEFGLMATGWGARFQSQSGLAGSFFSGVLATVVATPCSAPFLAPALGATLVLPPGQSFAVFTVIALGLSAPYLLLSCFPAAVKILPRPGAWMEAFKQAMAFPLYATAGYLLWVLAGQTSESGQLMAFFGLTLVAMAAWCYGRFGAAGEGLNRGLGGFAVALALLIAGLFTGWPKAASADEIAWQAWSPEAVAQATHEGKTVYVDFTARWCATCQANKKVVFASADVRQAFQRLGIVAFKADWTNRDPRITAELAKWGRTAVPFNLVIKPGQAPAPLPELLTPGIVLHAVHGS